MKAPNETYSKGAVWVWDVLSGVAKMAWDVMSGVTKTAWDVMSGVTKTAWDVLSGVTNLSGMFCPGCHKMAWDVLSGSRIPMLAWIFKGSGVELLRNPIFFTFRGKGGPDPLLPLWFCECRSLVVLFQSSS